MRAIIIKRNVRTDDSVNPCKLHSTLHIRDYHLTGPVNSANERRYDITNIKQHILLNIKHNAETIDINKNEIMKTYKNASGKSPITEYMYDNTAISIWFKNTRYTYSICDIGETHFRMMISLAEQGQGLCSYINKHKDIKKGYSFKG